MAIHTISRAVKPCRLTNIDARAKLLFAAGCLVVSLISKRPVVPLVAGSLCLCFTVIAGARLREIALRLAGPIMFALLAFALQVLLPAKGIDAGLNAGSGIAARVYGASCIVLFLTLTTPADRLLSAAAWYRLPRGLVELLMLTYRYIFVLIDNAATVYHAQKSRLGYIGFRRSMASLGTLCGTVLLRAYSQAEATAASMKLRGYTGRYIPSCRETFRPGDAVFLSGVFSFCLALLIWTY